MRLQVIPVPGPGAEDVVLDALRFANGVAFAADESYVAVAETAARTVVRRWLTGQRAGERDLLADDRGAEEPRDAGQPPAPGCTSYQ